MIAEGAPTYPEPGRLWRLIARHRVTHFGTAPTLARMLRRDAEALLDSYDLSSLRAIPSSGEAWDGRNLALGGAAHRRRPCADPEFLGRDRDVRDRRLQHPVPAEACQLQRPGARDRRRHRRPGRRGACRPAKSASW